MSKSSAYWIIMTSSELISWSFVVYKIKFVGDKWTLIRAVANVLKKSPFWKLFLSNMWNWIKHQRAFPKYIWIFRWVEKYKSFRPKTVWFFSLLVLLLKKNVLIYYFKKKIISQISKVQILWTSFVNALPAILNSSAILDFQGRSNFLLSTWERKVFLLQTKPHYFKN
jgi:hypothetical protein